MRARSPQEEIIELLKENGGTSTHDFLAMAVSHNCDITESQAKGAIASLVWNEQVGFSNDGYVTLANKNYELDNLALCTVIAEYEVCIDTIEEILSRPVFDSNQHEMMVCGIKEAISTLKEALNE